MLAKSTAAFGSTPFVGVAKEVIHECRSSPRLSVFELGVSSPLDSCPWCRRRRRPWTTSLIPLISRVTGSCTQVSPMTELQHQTCPSRAQQVRVASCVRASGRSITMKSQPDSGGYSARVMLKESIVSGLSFSGLCVMSRRTPHSGVRRRGVG